MSEEQLIRRAQQGDNSAFEQLLLAHQKKVYNLCLRMAANPDDALDLSQESFIQAGRAMGQLAPDHREILQLRVVEDLPYEQIADILGVRVGTVKSRLARARLSLRKILKAGNYFDSASSEPVEGEVRL